MSRDIDQQLVACDTRDTFHVTLPLKSSFKGSLRRLRAVQQQPLDFVGCNRGSRPTKQKHVAGVPLTLLWVRPHLSKRASTNLASRFYARAVLNKKCSAHSSAVSLLSSVDQQV